MIYPCNPKLNIYCNKSGCFLNGGQCYSTKEKRFAAGTYPTASELIEEVREDMCTHYCKYSDRAMQLIDSDDQEALDKLCGECPLNRL